MGETRILGGDLSGSIEGYDANSLHLWSIGQPMPTQIYATLERKDESSPLQVNTTRREKYLKMFRWPDAVSEERCIPDQTQVERGS